MNRILIIDDEPTIRMLLTRILELEGYEVLSAKDRVTALYTLKNNEVQVVLCDVFLPDGNGAGAATIGSIGQNHTLDSSWKHP